MPKIVIVDEEVINEIRDNQYQILKKLDVVNNIDEDDQYISSKKAAQLFDCTDQTIVNLCEEGLFKKYGRGKFIRYSKSEIKKALGA